MPLIDSITRKKESQEHWFREYAKTIPVQYLPCAVVGAVRGIVFTFGRTRDKMREIREIIDVYDELIGKKGA